MPSPSPTLLSPRDAAEQADREQRLIEDAIMVALIPVLNRAASAAADAIVLGHDPGNAAQILISGTDHSGGVIDVLSAGAGRAFAGAWQNAVDRVAAVAGVESPKDAATAHAYVNSATVAQGGVSSMIVTVADELGRRAADYVRNYQNYVNETSAVLAPYYPHYTPEELGVIAAMIKAGLLVPLGWHTESAYTARAVVTGVAAAAWSAGESAAYENDTLVRVNLLGYEYVTMRDSKVRPTHAAMDGVKRPANDPLWRQWRCPAGWRCRCRLAAVFGGMEFEPTQDLPNVQPDSGWWGGRYHGHGFAFD